MAHFAVENDYPEAQMLIERATGLKLGQNRLHLRIHELEKAAWELQKTPGEPADVAPAAKCLVI